MDMQVWVSEGTDLGGLRRDLGPELQSMISRLPCWLPHFRDPGYVTAIYNLVLIGEYHICSNKLWEAAECDLNCLCQGQVCGW